MKIQVRGWVSSLSKHDKPHRSAFISCTDAEFPHLQFERGHTFRSKVVWPSCLKFDWLKALVLTYFLSFFQLSNLQQQRIMVEQLRREAAIKRINVSQAIEDIKVVPLFGHRKNSFYYVRDRTIGKTPFFYPSDFIARCTLRLRQANKAVH